MRYEYQVPEDRDPTDEEYGLMDEFDVIKQEIANVVTAIASEGIQDLKDKQASVEDKMMYGNETSPM
jgi:hypothetical protein